MENELERNKSSKQAKVAWTDGSYNDERKKTDLSTIGQDSGE